MKQVIIIPKGLHQTLHHHLFQGELEQGAFLFAHVANSPTELRLTVSDLYLVPPEGWRVQLDVYLEMKDTERAKIMHLARQKQLAIVDCHSHPGSQDEVCFSPSDIMGITDFATYTQWKLDGQPYAAMVWGEASVDAVIWQGTFSRAGQVNEIRIVNGRTDIVIPRGTWSRRKRLLWKGKIYER